MHGWRTPAIFFHQDVGIFFASSVNGNPNYNYSSQTHRPTVGKWSTTEVGQRGVKEEFIFYIMIEGQEVHSIRNDDPMEFYGVNVYSSNPWYTAQPGSIRGLVIESKLEGTKPWHHIYPPLDPGCSVRAHWGDGTCISSCADTCRRSIPSNSNQNGALIIGVIIGVGILVVLLAVTVVVWKQKSEVEVGTMFRNSQYGQVVSH